MASRRVILSSKIKKGKPQKIKEQFNVHTVYYAFHLYLLILIYFYIFLPFSYFSFFLFNMETDIHMIPCVIY